MEVYTNRYDNDVNLHLQLLQSNVTGDHSLKLSNTRMMSL